MTEKEKMKKGLWYDANYDKELLEERKKAEDLCFEFNHTKPSDSERKKRILKELLPNMEKDVSVSSPFYTDYGYNCIIGEKTFINHNAYLMDGALITIGKNCFIGPNCGIYTAKHPVIPEERNQGLEKAEKVTIGDNVWFGGDVTVLPGVKIGNNCVVGAKSVVTKDIPDNVIAGGNPCRVIRTITEKDSIFFNKKEVENMNKSWIDLHMHSNISNDGDFTPAELMKKCSEAGLKVIAVADHNSVKGVQEALKAAEKYNLKVIPAVEIDCTYGEYNLHVAGYNIDYTNNIFKEIEKSILEQEIKAGNKRMELVKKAGFFFNEEKVRALSPDGTITGEMIAEVILTDERNNNNLLIQPYLKGGNRSDNPYVNFYWDWCSKGKPAYVEIKYITVKEAVDIIHKTGGKAVFAHPNNNIGMNEKVFSEIISNGIDGVEAYSSYHSPEAVKFYVEMADKHNIAVTCGSDFHGKTKPAIKLGNIFCDNREDEIFSFVK